MTRVDIAIIGAGMAGASLAAEIGNAARVLLIEREAQPGYHSTGRSAAFWSETYGGPAVQPLTTASGPWLEAGGFLKERGGLHIADAAGMAALDALQASFAETPVALERVDRAELEGILPKLRPEWRAGLREPTCRDSSFAMPRSSAFRARRDVGGSTRGRGRWRRTSSSTPPEHGRAQSQRLARLRRSWSPPIGAR
jgi:D-arginine dehydrogenase